MHFENSIKDRIELYFVKSVGDKYFHSNKMKFNWAEAAYFYRLHSPSTEIVTISLSSTSQRRLIIGPFIRRTTKTNVQFDLDRACEEHHFVIVLSTIQDMQLNTL